MDTKPPPIGFAVEDDSGYTRAALRHALDRGLRFFAAFADGANEQAEALIGETVPTEHEATLVVAGGRSGGFHPNALRRAVDETRRRLRRDAVPIYLLDRPSRAELERLRPMETLRELEQRGIVLHIGASADCEEDGFAALDDGADVLAVPFSILEPRLGYRLIGAAHERGVTVLARDPTARGRLGGIPSGPPADGETARALVKLAFLRRGGRTLAQAAILFALAHEGVASAIVRPQTPADVDEALGALDAPPLDEHDLERIFELTAGCFQEE